MGTEPDAADGARPSSTELELSAVAEAMNQMMAAAAGATSAVLGTEVEIGLPRRAFASADAGDRRLRADARTRRAPPSRCAASPAGSSSSCPNAFIVRMTRALDELGAEIAAPAPARGGRRADGPPTARRRSPASRCASGAELGRARMASAEIVGLPPGAVVELDRQADEPIDLYVNGGASRPAGCGRRRRRLGRPRSNVLGQTDNDTARRRWPEWPACSSSTTPRSCARW